MTFIAPVPKQGFSLKRTQSDSALGHRVIPHTGYSFGALPKRKGKKTFESVGE